MKPAVVSASCHPPKAGAVLGSTNGCLLPMAPWVALGPWLGFVRGPFRLRKPLLLSASGWHSTAALPGTFLGSNGGVAGLKHEVQN